MTQKQVRKTALTLDALLTQACQGVEGIDAATFRTLLSPEDIEDIEGGHIPMVTLNAYAKSFAEGIRTGRITVLAAVIPKAALTSRIRCVDCRHFELDTIGDGSGIGRCKIPALWANAERERKDFSSINPGGYTSQRGPRVCLNNAAAKSIKNRVRSVTDHPPRSTIQGRLPVA